MLNKNKNCLQRNIISDRTVFKVENKKGNFFVPLFFQTIMSRLNVEELKAE